MNILVLVSGGGTNLQALLDAEKEGVYCPGKITLVVSDRPGVYALERAKNAGVAALVAEPDRTIPKENRRRELSDRVLRLAETHNISLIVLAGFLSILEGEIIRRYSGKLPL